MTPNNLPELISNHSAEENSKREIPAVPHKDPAQEAREVRMSKGFEELPPEELENGGRLLRARVTDAFCFVDRPQVELDASGDQIVSYSCDCPKWRLERSFCAHCAALVLGLQETKVTYSAAEGGQPREDVSEEDLDGSDELDDQEIKGPTLMDLSYKFCNSSYDLYPFDKTPRIPLERYILIYGDNARARSLYKRFASWGGSCFGFTSSTSMLYQPDGGMKVTDFEPEAQYPSQVNMHKYSPTLGMSLHSFIEAMQITQYGNGLWYDISLDDFADAVEAFQNGEGEPVSMGIQSSARSCDGHAVLPFRLERTDGAEDILHIYDPNYPLQTRFGYLEKDEEGHYVHWRFPMSERKTYGSKTGGILDHSPYRSFLEVWNNRGGRDGKNLLLVKPGAAILNAAGALLARVTENGVETFHEDIVPISVKEGPSDRDPILSVPAGTFRVTLENPELEELTVQMIGVDLAVDLSTVAREAEVCVDDENKSAFIRIPERNARYSIEILNTLDETEEEALLCGMTEGEALSLLQEYGKLYASGLTEKAGLCINRENTPLTVIGKLLEEQEEEMLIANSAAEKPQEPQEPQG